MYRKTKGDCYQIINIIKVLAGLKEPSQKEKKILQYMLKYDLDGWIINPEKLLNNNYSTNMEKCVAIHIASIRNLNDFRERGIASIPIFIVEEYYNIDNLKNNRLFKIENDKIYLEY